MNKRILLLCFLALCCLETYAQEFISDSVSIQNLDEVVVSDSRFALNRENSGKTVIKITTEELERSQGRSVAELINTRSGIEVNGSRSYAGQNISVFARGGNNRQVLVVIDGIQVSDPSNVNAEYDLRLLNLAQIESIEIVKGAASALYGNAAATAVIYITTKKAAKDGVSLEVTSSLGTNQSQSEQDYNISDFANNFALQSKKDKLSILVSGGHQYTDGLSAAIGTESDAFSRIDGNVTLGYRFSNKFHISASAFYNKLKSDFDNGFPVEDADFSFRSEQSRFSLSSAYDYNNGSLQFNGAMNQISRSFASDFPSAFDSQSAILDVFNKYTFDEKFFTVLGVNLIDNQTLFSEQRTTTSVDPYVNTVFISDFGLNINAGARWNNHSEYGSNLIYNLNPSYRIQTNAGYIKFLGSYATSFIAPNLSQLFGPFGPNPDLQPEENATLEGGIEYRPSDKFRISALYFDRKEDNRIQFVTIDPTTFESQYRNSDTMAKFNGVEVELQATPLEDLTVTANYTYTEADEGLALRIPKNKINASIGYEFAKNTFMSLTYQYVSERSDTDFASFSTIELEPFNLIDLYAKHDFNKTFSMFISINNLFNEQYFEVIDFTTKGRNIRIGFNLKL